MRAIVGIRDSRIADYIAFLRRLVCSKVLLTLAERVSPRSMDRVSCVWGEHVEPFVRTLSAGYRRSTKNGAVFVVVGSLLSMTNVPAQTIRTNERGSTFKVCNAALPHQLLKYKMEVVGAYGKLTCQEGRTNEAVVTARSDATIVVSSKADGQDPGIVAHEMMHLWLGSRGWNMSGRYVVPAVEILPEGGQQAVDESFAALEDYLEHRKFSPLLRAAGISNRKAALAMLHEEELQEGIDRPFPPVLLAGVYLEMHVADPYVGQLFEDFLRRTGREQALRAADEMNEVIERENPQMQVEALWAIRDCFRIMFRPGSPYLKLVPNQPNSTR